MSLVTVTCHGSYVDADTGETRHAHEVENLLEFYVAVMRHELFSGELAFGNQLIDDGTSLPVPNDMELLDERTEDDPPIRTRYAMECPQCGESLRLRHESAGRIFAALAAHGVAEVDIRSLRAYALS